MKINNPYQAIYQENRVSITSATTLQEAEEMSRQLSMIYNTFGLALKDLINLLSHRYPNKQESATQPKIIKQKPASDSASNNSSSQRVFGPFKSKGAKYLKVEAIREQKNEGIDFEKYAHKLMDEISKPSKIQTEIEESSRNFERIENPRGKKQRQTLNGYSCLECRDFYKALGEEFNDADGTNKLCNGCSRHRSNLPPTNYFTCYSQEFGFED